MTAPSEEPARFRVEPGADPAGGPDHGAGVLADRIAVTLAGHEPGWRLPRASELARRHHVSPDEAAAAIDYLVARQLVRRSPDGCLYRAGPADYLVSLENMAGLGATVDPMGRALTCLSYAAERRPAPEEAARALGMRSGEPVGVVRLVWALDGRPAAMSTTYLATGLPDPPDLADWVTGAAGHGPVPVRPPPAGHDGRLDPWPPVTLSAASVQMDLPPSSVAQRLRLARGQMAVLVTVLFGSRPGCPLAALTTAVLRPDLFRVTVGTAAPETAGHGLRPAWSLAAGDRAL
jgi:hypothetical protein